MTIHFNFLDIDECAVDLHACHSNATCNDTESSYNCTCKPGFHGDGKTSCKGKYDLVLSLDVFKWLTSFTIDVTGS